MIWLGEVELNKIARVLRITPVQRQLAFAGQMQAADALYVLANVLQLNPGLEAVA